MILAHLHVPGCPCSRCRVSRNYARLLAAVAPGLEADTVEPLATEQLRVLAEPERSDLDVVLHG